MKAPSITHYTKQMIDTLLHVPFKGGSIKITHITMMGDIGDVFAIGNAYRLSEGRKSLPLATWIQRDDVTEYVGFLSEKLGRPAIERRRGKNGGTYAHLNILLDAATSLSPAFKHEVYEMFVNNRLLASRDDSGEAFKDVNTLLSLCAENLLGKPAHKGHFIHLANLIKSKVLPEGHPGWNMADAYQLHQRTAVEEKIKTVLETGLVKDWEHLKEIIGKISI